MNINVIDILTIHQIICQNLGKKIRLKLMMTHLEGKTAILTLNSRLQ